jgi:molecular chaperone GrpE (heat shock protein)
MEEKNLKLAQEDIDEALKVVEDLERFLDAQSSPKEVIKEKFIFLSKTLQKLEDILKSEGIL